LASSNRSLDEAVGDAALKFNPYKVSDISNTMNYYFKNKKKIKPVLIKKGLQRVKNFSWEKMTKEVNKIYKDLN
jgi:glycosyltransferase involved in cell wall biosynthesis